jgi:stearoyl-CoA desaturase (delta-9 desaturase)
MEFGLLTLPWWGYVLATLGLTHLTILCTTVFLHRSQAHRALDLHPAVMHVFRFWLWIATGTVTKAWVAIHRKHHARCETPEDPHSPQVLGIRKVLFQGYELYRDEAKNAETLSRYGHGTPDDWLERHVYTPHSYTGIVIMLAIDLVLFGPIGLTIWAVQMVWIPFFAAGVINGVGHYWGYRNYTCDDASTNIVPWGLFIGGEELHNNHHAYASSAKLSQRWYEFDLGWAYIRILETLGLARVNRVAPRICWGEVKRFCDADLLSAIITHRYDVLTRYTRGMKRLYRQELARLPEARQLRKLLNLDRAALGAEQLARLQALLSEHPRLNTAYQMRQELSALWARSTLSTEQLVRQLQDWCQRAEQSGIEALAEFSLRLRRYA